MSEWSGVWLRVHEQRPCPPESQSIDFSCYVCGFNTKNVFITYSLYHHPRPSCLCLWNEEHNTLGVSTAYLEHGWQSVSAVFLLDIHRFYIPELETPSLLLAACRGSPVESARLTQYTLEILAYALFELNYARKCNMRVEQLDSGFRAMKRSRRNLHVP